MSELNFTHSNGNKVKLTTPDTLAANRTFKLPGADGTAGQVLMTDGNGNLSFVDPPYSVYDKWVGASTTTGRQNPYTNWVRHSYTGVHIATGMSHSSGIFTFPKTGLYKVTLDLAMLTSGASQDNYANVRIELSTNSGGAFTTLKEVITGGIQNLASGHSGHVFINVTDASTFRVRFQTASLGSGSTVRGNAANSMAYTTVSFERLTDAQS